MRRAAVALLLMGLAVAGCTHPTRNPPSRSAVTRPSSSVLTPPTQAGSMPSIRGRSTRPAGWKVVRYRGISFFVPATWRVRDARKFPGVGPFRTEVVCPAILPGPAVVLGHSDVIPPCPMPRLRTPLLWIDDRMDDRLPATAATIRINGLAVWLLRVHPDNLRQASSDEVMYWSQYRRARGFQVWVLQQGVRAELLDPAGGVVADQVLSTLHRS
jgi:hypothetical protein